jgi:hypothetical protein
MGWRLPFRRWCWRRFHTCRRGLVSIGPARCVLPVIPRQRALRRTGQRFEHHDSQSHSGHKRLQHRLCQQDRERNQRSLSKSGWTQCGHCSLAPSICGRAASKSQHRPSGFERSGFCAGRAPDAECGAASSQRGRSSCARARASFGSSDGSPGDG